MRNYLIKSKNGAVNSVGKKAAKLSRNIFSNSILIRFFILLLFITAFVVRLYKIDKPLGDWHSWRQSDTAAVTWFYLHHRAKLLKPRIFDISNIPSGKDNPHGYRFVEFPIYNLSALGINKAFSFLGINSKFNYPFEVSSRLTNIFVWLIGAYYLYLLLSLVANQELGIAVLIFYLFLPYGIYYSRTILPGPMAINLSIISLYYLTLFFLKRRKVFLILWSIFTALALLAKPYSIFLFTIYSLLIWFKLLKKDKKEFFWLSTAGLVAIIPFLWWRWWMIHFPAGIPANHWLLNGGGMRFKPVWWRWLFYERLSKLILGGWGVFFLINSIFIKRLKNKFKYFPLTNELYLSLVSGGLAYLSIFARGNIQHDYYQIFILPAVVLSMALGLLVTIDLINQARVNSLSFWSQTITILFVLTFTFLFSWFQIREYYKINDLRVIKTIEQLRKTLPPQSKIITNYQGNSLLLYHFKLQGWPAVTTNISTLKKKGADYFFSSIRDETTNKLIKTCPTVNQLNGCYLIKLDNCHVKN